MAGDAHVYYAVLREQRPRRVVEARGAGRSTQVAIAAIAANRAEGHDATLAAIETISRPRIWRALSTSDDRTLCSQKCRTWTSTC